MVSAGEFTYTGRRFSIAWGIRMSFFRNIRRTGVVVLMTGLALPAYAEMSADAKIRELESKLERSMALIEQLSIKVGQLEKANAGAHETQAQSAQQSAKIERIEKHVAEIGESVSQRASDAGIPLHGFADVGLVASAEDNPTHKGHKGAAIGALSLFLTPNLGDRVRSLVELALETEEGGEAFAEFERAQIGYTFSDAATGWLGRFHTPYGYWNTAFHHGAQIQTSILRPRFVDFEDHGGILPAHTTGLWLTGAFAMAPGRFGYDAYAGNAPQINGTSGSLASPSALSALNPGGLSPTVAAGKYAGSGALSPRQSGSTTQRTSVGFNTWLEPRSMEGLRLGLHGLRANVADDSADANLTRLNMLGGYAVYQGEPWEILGEYYRFHNNDLSGGSGKHDSWAGYAQIGRRFGLWTPFARVERTELDQMDNYFAVQESGRSYQRAAIGIRYDVDPKAALKLEVNSTRKEDLGSAGSDSYVETRAQYSIRF